MVDVLMISLPSFWGRKYVYVENHWMILLSQYISSCGIKISVMDAALEDASLTMVGDRVKLVNPKVIVFLVAKKNWEMVAQAKTHLTKQFLIPNVLVWDDSFSFNESNSLIPEDSNSVNSNAGDFIFSICSLLNKSSVSSSYSNSTLLVGRDYLKQVLLEGGEFEVLGKVSKNSNYFPSDYEFNTRKHHQIEHDFSIVLKEVKTICETHSVRKFNIIDDDLSDNIQRIDEIKSFLDNNNLSHVKLGLIINSRAIIKENVEFLINRRNFIYKVAVSLDFITREHILLFKNMTDNGLKVKVLFCLFNEDATIEHIQSLIEAIREQGFFISPKALITGTVSDPILQNIKKIMRLIYYRIFHAYHIKIIQYENDQKYEMRVGVNKDYESVVRIQKEVDYLSNSLNNVFLDIFESAIVQCHNCIDAQKIVIDLLKQYENEILDIGGEIDAHLSSTCRI